VTAGKVVPKMDGNPWERSFSRFWPTMEATGPLDNAGIVDWIKTASWSDIQNR
jgi:hypothetical protein